jgi:hypothetical protein
MITLFELKNKSILRFFVRTPFYLRNFVLLVQLAFLLLCVYLVYFRKDGMVIQNITKILKGLNSNTFNYLTSHSESLRLTKLLNNYGYPITSNQFMDDCLRISKPCKFGNLSKTWPAYKKWRYDEKEGYSYLEKKLGSTYLNVYVDD